MAEGSDFNVPIRALGTRTRRHLSTLVNQIKVFATEDNLDRYWPGLAQLCEIDSTHRGYYEFQSDPCDLILTEWEKKDSENNTVQKLLEFLQKMDRFDVIEDLEEEICHDVRVYKTQPTKCTVGADLDKRVITSDDVESISNGQGVQMYDAFVLYAEEDIEFANELINTMENDPYNMKLCTVNRDFVCLGEYTIKAKKAMISERCKKVIVILSDAFMKTPDVSMIDYTESVGIKMDERKLIPCVYKHFTEIPNNLTGITLLDFERSHFNNAYKRLAHAIKSVSNLQNIEEPKRMANVKSNNNLSVGRRNQTLSFKLPTPPTEPIIIPESNSNASNSVENADRNQKKNSKLKKFLQNPRQFLTKRNHSEKCVQNVS